MKNLKSFFIFGLLLSTLAFAKEEPVYPQKWECSVVTTDHGGVYDNDDVYHPHFSAKVTIEKVSERHEIFTSSPEYKITYSFGMHTIAIGSDKTQFVFLKDYVMSEHSACSFSETNKKFVQCLDVVITPEARYLKNRFSVSEVATTSVYNPVINGEIKTSTHLRAAFSLQGKAFADFLNAQVTEFSFPARDEREYTADELNVSCGWVE